MSRINSQRKSCIDVFNAFLVRLATYAGIFEFPCIKATYDIPNKLISFSNCISCKDYNQWVHFYEDDHLFERIWRKPQNYLDILKRFNGVKVIPNIRFGDRRTYRICCDGIEKHCVIAVGSHGNLKLVEDREIFLKGLDVIVKILRPTTIVVYGAAPEKYFKKYKDAGIRIVQFDSNYAISHKEVV